MKADTKDGRKPKASKVITVRLPVEFHRQLRRRLFDIGCSLQFVITQQLRQWLRDQRKKKTVPETGPVEDLETAPAELKP